MLSSDVISTFVMYRFLLSASLVLGGIACVWFGYKLFLNGTGLAQGINKFDFRNGKHRIAAAGISVGSVLVLTSGVWGYFAHSSFPRLEANAGGVVISGLPGSKLVGADVVLASQHKVGKVWDVLMNSRAKTIGVIVDLEGSGSDKKVVFDPKDFELKQNKAVLKKTQEEIRFAPVFNPIDRGLIAHDPTRKGS